MGRKFTMILLACLGCLICYPVLFLLSGSFTHNNELQANLQPMMTERAGGFVQWDLIPFYPTLRYYVELLLDSPEFFQMFWNSVKLTVSILLLQLVVGMPAAWGFSKYNFPGRRTLFTIYIILMMMPFQVTMLSSYLVLDRFALIDTHWAVILPAGFSAFPVFIMYRFFSGIPDEILEAGEIDGASKLQIFRFVAIPLGSAGVISAMVLGFLEYWNLIEQPMTFLSTKSLWLLSLYLPEINLANAGVAFVSSVIVLIPAALVFIGGQDYLERGITASAIKE